MQPKCTHREGIYCVREKCIGPCITVWEKEISSENLKRLSNFIDSTNKTMN